MHSFDLCVVPLPLLSRGSLQCLILAMSSWSLIAIQTLRCRPFSHPMRLKSFVLQKTKQHRPCVIHHFCRPACAFQGASPRGDSLRTRSGRDGYIATSDHIVYFIPLWHNPRQTILTRWKITSEFQSIAIVLGLVNVGLKGAVLERSIKQKKEKEVKT